jgi:hypothetical protein
MARQERTAGTVMDLPLDESGHLPQKLLSERKSAENANAARFIRAEIIAIAQELSDRTRSRKPAQNFGA